MKSLSVLLITFSLLSCNRSHDLTRESAQALLQSRYPERKEMTLSITGWCSPFQSPDGKRMVAAARQLEQAGYLTFSTFTGQYLDGYHTDCRITFTEKGKPFLMKTTEDWYAVDAFHINVGEVTGIADGSTPTSKIVEFTTTISSTPFSPCFNINFQEVQRRKAAFQKYDDGWRFQNMVE